MKIILLPAAIVIVMIGLNEPQFAYGAALPCSTWRLPDAVGQRLKDALGDLSNAIHSQKWRLVRYYIKANALSWKQIVPLTRSDTNVRRLVRNEYLNAKLLAAVEENDVSQVESLLKEGASVNTRAIDSGSFTPLMIASHCGYLRVAVSLVEAGASVNAKAWEVYGVRGRLVATTALIQAARAGRTVLVRFLIKEGANPNAQSMLIQYAFSKHPVRIQAFTSLIVGAGYPEVVKELVAHGANPNVATVEGVTPLMMASQYGAVGSVRALISAGANVCSEDTRGRPVLSYAESGGATEIISILHQRVKRYCKVRLRRNRN